MSTAQDLARELSISDRTVRRAVDRDLIRGRRPTPNKLEISESERSYALTHWRLLQDLVLALRTEPSVLTAILYGSTARGDDSDDSDIDLVVELRPGVSALVGEVGMRLTRALDREVEVVSLDDATNEPRFLLDVLTEGRPLVDRENRWAKLRSRRPALVRAARVRNAERTRAAHEVWAGLEG